jgi:signal peptidase II
MNYLKEKKLFFTGIFIAFLVAFFDLLTKRIVFSTLENIAFEQFTKYPEIKITSFFNIVYVWNYGVSFGMFNKIENSQIIFCLLQLTIAFILCFWLYNDNRIQRVFALGFIIGGALGNSIDRAKNGAVADFLDFHLASYHWPAFNLADSFVFIGVMILLLEDFIFKNSKK